MTLKKSSLFKLNWKDVGKAIAVFFITTLIAGLYQLSQTGELFVWAQVKVTLSTAVFATVSYFIKNFLTNSNDKILKKELKSLKY